MHVEVRRIEDVIIADLEGRLVGGFGDEILREVTNELVAEGWKKILLNLSAVSRIDSAGIGELVASVRFARRLGTSIKLLHVAGRVREVLELSRVLPMLQVYDEESEALEAFSSEELPPDPTHLKIVKVANEDDWQEARKIRERVFIEEQDCPPEEEWDEHDATSQHVLGRLDDASVATARWRVVDADGERAAKLERFAILPEYRGRGFGRQLVQNVLEEARAKGYRYFLVHAQTHLEDFYRLFGFEPVGERFEEAGIEHVRMMLNDG